MRASILLSGFAAAASALAVEKRDGNCAAQPAGTGPAVFPDTPQIFVNNPLFATAALASFAPAGYTRAFTNSHGSTTGGGYMGYVLFNSYNVAGCTAMCSALDGCAGVDLFYERDPSVDPNATDCPNPRSVTNIKCSLWSVPVSTATATNVGEKRDSFQVVIAGSNGYNKN